MGCDFEDYQANQDDYFALLLSQAVICSIVVTVILYKYGSFIKSATRYLMPLSCLIILL